MPKILVIDDDGIVRDALMVFLARAGYDVITAADGPNGLQAFKNQSPDLVILDRNLPLMSGSRVFDSIREVSRTVPIVVVSGYDNPEEVAAYMRFGAAAFLAKSDGLSQVLETVDKLLNSAGREPSSIPRPAGSPATKALIADDDPAIRAILRRLLAGLSFEVMEAEDGSQAVALAMKFRPDLVLLDIVMPGKTGDQVLKQLRAELPGAEFIMVTGSNDERVGKECLSMGCLDYISKPVNLEMLERKLRLWLLAKGK